MPATPAEGVVNRKLQYVGEIRLIHTKTRKPRSQHIFLSERDGRWRVYHLDGRKVIEAEAVKVTTSAKRGEGGVSFVPTDLIPFVDVVFNDDGTMTYDVGFFFHIHYTVDMPEPENPTGPGDANSATPPYCY